MLQAGLPLFMDKPIGGSLAEVLAIYTIAAGLNAPVFSASSLRWLPSLIPFQHSPAVLGCEAHSPCALETEYAAAPDLFFYGVHGVEMLCSVMGPGLATGKTTHDLSSDCNYLVSSFDS